MADPTSALNYDDICKEVANYIGWGRTAYASLTKAQQTEVDAHIQAGLREFYTPPLLPGQRETHEWSFLKPWTTIVLWSTASGTVTGVAGASTTTLTATTSIFYPSMIGHSVVIADTGTFTVTGYTSATVITVSGDATCVAKAISIAADGDYRLPDNFGGIIGFLYFEPTTGYPPVAVYGEGEIMRSRMSHTSPGRPLRVAIHPAACDGTTGQRYDMQVHPTPDTNYTMHYRYIVQLDKLATGKYPLGGPAHSQTILAACLASAELYKNDARGVHYAEFMTRLATSIAHDRKTTSPAFMGYSGDSSQRPAVFERAAGLYYNGTKIT